MIRTGPLRAVVFDFDGTLVNSLPLVLASIAHALEPYGHAPTMDIFARLGGPPERFLPLMLKDPSHAPDALARMDAYHSANNHLVKVFEGAAAMLDCLKSAGIRAAVWTGRDRLSTEVLLRTLALGDSFAAVVCGDDLPSHKPDPAGLQEVMRKLGVMAAETLYVGDADVDVLGGRGCGVDTLLIRHGRQIDAGIAAQAWRTTATPSEAYDIVMRCVATAAPRS